MYWKIQLKIKKEISLTLGTSLLLEVGHILSTVQFDSVASSFGFHLHEQSILNTLYDYFFKCGHNKNIFAM